MTGPLGNICGWNIWEGVRGGGGGWVVLNCLPKKLAGISARGRDLQVPPFLQKPCARYSPCYRDICIRGAGGHCPPLNFDNPKRSKIVYVTCGTIICRVVAAARCKSSVIDFWIFFKYFLDVL